MEAGVCDVDAVVEGKELTITLPGNPAIGYKWVCSGISGAFELADASNAEGESD